VLTFQASLPPSRSIAQVTEFAEDLVTRLRALPVVRTAGYAESLPMIPVGRGVRIATSPDIPRPGSKAPYAGLLPADVPLDVRIVSHDFLAAMGTQVIIGRAFNEGDGATHPQVVLINESLARSGVLGDHPVGQRVYLGGTVTFDPGIRDGTIASLQPWEIVGVVKDVHQFSVTREPGAQIFVDQRQLPGPTGGASVNVALRIDGEPKQVTSTLRALVTQVDAEALLENVVPMDQVVASTLARPRLYAISLALFAGIAVALAAIGIYGVMAFAVTQRTREIGVRMALGARRAQVMRMVIGQSAAITSAGVVVGAAVAGAASRLLDTLLFGVSPLDPMTFGGVCVAFSTVAALAAMIPARRAASVDPVLTLRCE
jgi:putative ABC transport system permease protein